MKKSLGYNIEGTPKVEGTQNDPKCPHTGTVSIRGKLFEGIVVSDSMNKTVKVQWDTVVKDKKFSRYYKKRTKVAAHNSAAVNAKKGDKVLIGETRPLSKTKHFVVIKVLNAEETSK